ncbi:MAG TPA: response regulator [Candidatus Moranbacteria bacterium]|nr:response regulator [Candidatus Moranbacteria bacterium]
MKKSILFVEDNAIAQSLISEVFGTENQIEITGDYATAMEKLSQGQYDLVITDIFFPQETGTGKKEMAGELAERLKNFVKEKGIENFFETLEEALFNKEFIEDEKKLTYKLKYVKNEIRHITYCVEKAERIAGAVDSWLSSQDEADQPLGILVAEECEKRGLKFRMASSLFHHNDKLEAINQFVSSKKWSDIFDYGHKNSSGEELENPKEHRIFWEEMRKEVTKGSAA